MTTPTITQQHRDAAARINHLMHNCGAYDTVPEIDIAKIIAEHCPHSDADRRIAEAIETCDDWITSHYPYRSEIDEAIVDRAQDLKNILEGKATP